MHDQSIIVVHAFDDPPGNLLPVFPRGMLDLQHLGSALVQLCNALLQFGNREALCVGTLVGHLLNTPHVVFLNKSITGPEPVSPRLFIDGGSHGHFVKGAAERCIAELKRPTDFDLFTQTSTLAAKGWWQPQRWSTDF